jgi:hypothetical protein
MVHSKNKEAYKSPISHNWYSEFFATIPLKQLALLGVLIICSCKKYDLDYWPVTYPKDVEEQMNLFMDYAPAGIKTKPLTIKLTNELFVDGKKVSGICSKKKKTIYLDTTSVLWHSSRTRLVMHELGHFVLRRDHLNDTTTIFNTWQGFPVSFMILDSARPSDWNLQRVDLLDYYMQELFKPYIPGIKSKG